MTIQEILAIPQDQQKIPLTARIDSIVPHAKGHTVQLTDATGTLPKVLIWTSKFAEAPSLNMVPVGTQGEFSLTKKAYNGQWDYNGYLMKVAGIQNVSAPQPTAPAPAPAPQQGQQGPAPTDPTVGRISRACVINQRDGLCQVLEQEARQKGMTTIDIADMFAKWIETGFWAMPKTTAAVPSQQPAQQPMQQQQGSGQYDPNEIPPDGIPF